ncbi:hypothetical protein [Aquibacillus kalidii]|uniref:hypothetical protein n=1 Tax=Aquibacillus kalidii TaxID=2762597 RepID=UPI0016443DD5|nr:hypothetical protein [Aquibacillus kalidii]
MGSKFFKSISLIVVFTLVLSTLGPILVNNKVSAASLTSSTEATDTNYDNDLFDIDSPTFEQDLIASKLIYQQEFLKQTKGEYQTQGVVGIGLKGIKAFGKIVKNGGHMLSWVLKPFSKKYADAVKRNSKKIGNAFAKPEKASKSYIQNRLISFGVPKDDAKMITKIVFWLI